MEALVDRLPALRRACEPIGPLEIHAGVMPAADPAATPLVAPGLLLAGDAGVQGSTLLGEGIRHAIAAGRLAGTVGAGVLTGTAGSPSAEALAAYPEAWRRQIGRRMEVAYRLHLRVCRYGDEDWTHVLAAVAHLRPGQVARALAGDLTPAWAIWTLVSSPGVVFGRSGRSLVRSALDR
jgi:digeranylgeranylglycerophospholipid reductase